MNKVTVTVTRKGQSHSLEADPALPVSQVLRENKLLHHPCGGNGSCGKCLIVADTVPTIEECRKLSPVAIAGKQRLACYTKAQQGLQIHIPDQAESVVLTSFRAGSYPYEPILRCVTFEITEPNLAEQRTDLSTIMKSCGATSHRLDLNSLSRLPEYLRSRQTGYANVQQQELVGFADSDDHLLLYVDIGTTTVAATLFDIESSTVLEAMGEHNSQAIFGDDVISRINHTIEKGGEGLKDLQSLIVAQLNGLLDTLLERARSKGRTFTDVSMLSITGNTTMMHLLCGLPPVNIGRAPFTPVTLESMHLSASELGLNTGGRIYIMPGISGYVGADIVASLLSADAHRSQESFLLVDFGTNAELVLKADGKLYSCSTAAGPCFEGATLSCGTVAKEGAIDTIFATRDGFSFTTIGGVEPLGLCGSAVIDAIALLLDSGDLDETGRINGGGTLDSFIGEREGHPAFILSKNIYLSQEDIRKIQLAKAAVRAGIETLLQEADIRCGKIDTLYFAGGFGSALNGESGVRIGLVPAVLETKIRILGNAASYGALRYVTEKDVEQKVAAMQEMTNYIELSAHLGFTNEYVAQMTFPEQNSQAHREISLPAAA